MTRAEPARKKATYSDLCGIPENMTGEIIDGELVVAPRPSRRHTLAASRLGGEIIPPYDFGRGGGPGGWIILDKPEISLGEDILVPDLAAWRKGRFPYSEETNWISVPPDWVCEIISPSTVRVDKVRKMPIYAQYMVYRTSGSSTPLPGPWMPSGSNPASGSCCRPSPRTTRCGPNRSMKPK
nr:Uma2 family endonuclease [Desulforhabdus amnigena]